MKHKREAIKTEEQDCKSCKRDDGRGGEQKVTILYM
jgi:hypothetical protein